jgi:predicted RNase H-like HicB family nuclease
LTLLSNRANHFRRMKTFTAVVERDSATGLLVGHVPGFSAAHRQAATCEELQGNLSGVIGTLLEDGDPLGQ